MNDSAAESKKCESWNIPRIGRYCIYFYENDGENMKGEENILDPKVVKFVLILGLSFGVMIIF